MRRVLGFTFLALASTACGGSGEISERPLFEGAGDTMNPAFPTAGEPGVPGSPTGPDGTPIDSPTEPGLAPPWVAPEDQGTAAAHEMAMDECGLDTGFEGDEQCILPPPPHLGFQVHVGPADYDNPDALFVLQPGEERTDDIPTTASNAEDVFFYYRQYRMRPTAHHVILDVPGSFWSGHRIGTANTSQDFPAAGAIAPENQGVGIPLDAHSPIEVSLHAINVGDTPQLREVWVNFWYRDPALVTEVAEQVFETGDMGLAVQPYADTILGPYTCDIDRPGRMLWFYGHRHANNIRFSTWRVRGSQVDLIYEGYDWEDPLLLEYSSTVQNEPADAARGIEGGWSGILDLLPGDQLVWECHVVNQTPNVLRFTNQTFAGEMCIMDAETVGTNCR